MIKILNSTADIQMSSKKLEDIAPQIVLPDPSKSWEVLNVIDIIQMHFKNNAFIANFDAYNGADLWFLCKLGYNNLYGIDFRDDIFDMPFYTKIKYMIGDKYDSHFPDNMFDVVINLNIREHDFINFDKYFSEQKRIIKDGGLLLITAYYNEDKIYSEDFLVSGLYGKIFNQNEIEKLIKIANKFCFEPIYDEPLPKHIGSPYNWNNKNYTAIFIGLRLKKIQKKHSIKQINIVCPTKGTQNGIYAYSEYLSKRLKEEFGINSKIYDSFYDINNIFPVLYEYEASLPLPNDVLNKNVLIETHSLHFRFNFYYYKNKIKYSSTFKTKIVNVLHLIVGVAIGDIYYRYIASKELIDKREHDLEILDNSFVLAKSNSLVEKAYIKKYLLMPHIAYPKFNMEINTNIELKLGSFGFAFKFKNFHKVCKLAKKLNIPLILLLSIPERKSTDGDKLERERALKLANKIKKKYESKTIQIEIGFFDDKYIAKELSNCSHIIFAQKSANQTSGSMRFAIALNKPVIALDSYQAREAQVYRVKRLSNINLEYLSTHKESINIDDGLQYLIKILESGEFDQKYCGK